MAVKDREIHTWIFGIGGSETDNVITQLVRGYKKTGYTAHAAQSKERQE